VSEVEKLRLFVAVSVPDEVRDRIDEEVAPLKSKWSKARWIALENQHVTLKFLGWTPSDRLEVVTQAIGMVARGHGPSEVSITGLGAFPSERRMRVLWVGLDDPGSLLTRVEADLERAFEPLGYPTEERPFTPHLTLARFKIPERPKDPLPELSGSFAPFVVDRLELFRSRLHPKGASYEMMESFDLTGQDG
jgi:2'-5' RNA ligase